MLEKELEQLFRKRLIELGCLPLKFVSPGMAGVPDRIVLIPGGHVVFVELKRPGEVLRPLQRYTAEKFSHLGFPVFVVDSESSLALFIQCLEQYYGKWRYERKRTEH